MYETRGSIKWIGDSQTFPSGFVKREFVVTTAHDKYPQDLKFEMVKEKCSLLDSFTLGEEVAVSFDIRGNAYNGKYFVNLSCWKLQRDSGASSGAPGESSAARSRSAPGAAAPRAAGAEPHPSELRDDEDFDDDIPF
jgi:single-strand DNA-binding protein